MKHELFQQIISDFHARPLPTVTRRDLALQPTPGKIISLTGPRRAGKTYLLYQCMHDLLVTGIVKENLLYINFEDERLYPLLAKELGLILDAYFALYPEKTEETIYLFLDEIQNVEGWERFVRRVHDSTRAHIYLTGSSAHLLSHELATALRGRTITYEILPFSFREVLRHLSIDPVRADSHTQARLQHALAGYLQRGGFPEVITAREEVWRMILHDYLNLMIYRDVVDRHQLKNRAVIHYLMRTLLRNTAAPCTVHKLYRDLKSQGFRVGKATLHQYVHYFEEVSCVRMVPIYSPSLRVQQVNYRKVYAVDIGFVTAAHDRLNEQRGQLLENIVFLRLLRTPLRQIYYYKTRAGREVDFLVVERGKMRLIQVTEHLDHPSTREEEIASLFTAMRELGLTTATIVTQATDEIITQKKQRIAIVPLAKWLLADDAG